VPHLVGQTTAAATAKSPGAGQLWTKETFLDAASTRVSDVEMKLIDQLFTDVETRGVKLNWGKGISPSRPASQAGTCLADGRRDSGRSANTEVATSKAYLQFYLADHLARTGPDVMEKGAALPVGGEELGTEGLSCLAAAEGPAVSLGPRTPAHVVGRLAPAPSTSVRPRCARRKKRVQRGCSRRLLERLQPSVEIGSSDPQVAVGELEAGRAFLAARQS
jgi:hypothetical protein